MHVALITNTAWLEEEIGMFRYLVVGLIDEQVRVAQVVPATVDEQDLNPFGDWITWHDSRWSWMRRWRLTRHAESLSKLGVDLIHALDGRLWEGSLQLASRLNLPVVLTSTSAVDIPLVDKIVARLDTSRLAIAARTNPLGKRIQEQVGQTVAVRVIRPGIHVPAQAPAADKDGVLCGIISGTGRYDADYASLFEALHRVIADDPNAQFFLDSGGSDQHSLWQAAQHSGLLANVSLVPRQIGHRELLLGADVLIHPQALNRTRGLTLQAMALGMPVLARTDPWLDYLVEDQTAWLVEASEPASWYDLLRRVIENPVATIRLGTRARQWVRERHMTSQQVNRTLELYRIVSGKSLKFPNGD